MSPPLDCFWVATIASQKLQSAHALRKSYPHVFDEAKEDLVSWFALVIAYRLATCEQTWSVNEVIVLPNWRLAGRLTCDDRRLQEPIHADSIRVRLLFSAVLVRLRGQ